MKSKPDILNGRQAIADFMGFTDFRSVQKMIPHGFPAARVAGTWLASRRQIIEWIETQAKRQAK